VTRAISTQQVWESLSGRVGAFIRSRVGDEHATQDLVQETFLRIHDRLDTLTDDQRLAPWVFQIARHLVADHFRRRRPTAPLDRDPEGPSAEPDNLNDVVLSWIPALIDALPERYREVVRLYEIEGLGQAAIAERLGLSLTAVKSRVRRGREKLKEALHACCVFDLDRHGNVLDYGRRASSCCARCGCDTPGRQADDAGDSRSR